MTFVANTTGQITARAITVTAATGTKVYDGTTSSPAAPTITAGSLASGDMAAFTETFDTRNVAHGKTLTVAGSVNDGNSGNNYAVTLVSNTTGSVTVRAITVTAATNTKVFDGTTSAAAMPRSPRQPGRRRHGGLQRDLRHAQPRHGQDAHAGRLGQRRQRRQQLRGDLRRQHDRGDPLGDAHDHAASTSQASVVYGTVLTFTATVTASAGVLAPNQGSVDFFDTTASHDLGLGVFRGSAGTISTWTLATGVKTFNATTGDIITATYTPGAGFFGSSGTTTQTVTPLAITVTAVAASKVYDGMTSSTATPTVPSGIPDVVSTLAGSAYLSGSSDGTGSAARFYDPYGVAVDSEGNTYVADEGNDEIRKITPAGVVTTLAGSAGQIGSSNGTGSAARFDKPLAVAVDSAGNVYVADWQNQDIRKITPSGVVTTLAGSAGQIGSNNGTGSAARFYYPTDVAVDSAGNVYVADLDNDEIRKVTPSGAVTTLAGSVGQTGSSNGTGSAARFYNPCAVAVDSAGNIYVVRRLQFGHPRDHAVRRGYHAGRLRRTNGFQQWHRQRGKI